MSVTTSIEKYDQYDSKEYLDLFYNSEKPLDMDWYESDEADQYIWVFDISTEKKFPIGFLGFKEFQFQNEEEFIYIVKIYVFGPYKKYNNTEEVKVIDRGKVSKVLFDEIKVRAKGKTLLTLESASKKLDTYYKTIGFEFNTDISNKLSDIIDYKERDIMYLDLKKDERKLSSDDELKNLFG